MNQTYDDDAHLKNGFNVFQDTPADSKDLLFRDQATAAVTRFGIGIDTTRPWHGIWTSCSPSSMPERGGLSITTTTRRCRKRTYFALTILYKFHSGFVFQLAVLVYCCLVHTALLSNRQHPYHYRVCKCLSFRCGLLVSLSIHKTICNRAFPLPTRHLSVVWNSLLWHITSSPPLLWWRLHGGATLSQKHSHDWLRIFLAIVQIKIGQRDHSPCTGAKWWHKLQWPKLPQVSCGKSNFVYSVMWCFETGIPVFSILLDIFGVIDRGSHADAYK